MIQGRRLGEDGETRPPGGVGSPTGLHRIVRAASFGVAATVGFLVAEVVVVVGLYAVFGRVDVPSETSGSPGLLVLDVVALVIGVTVSFVLNERTGVASVAGGRRGRGVTVRLWKFQAVSALGNAVLIAVQLFLLSYFGVTPAIGNVIGGVVSFPVSYFISIRVVWG